jgi:hypothetical protein
MEPQDVRRRRGWPGRVKYAKGEVDSMLDGVDMVCKWWERRATCSRHNDYELERELNSSASPQEELRKVQLKECTSGPLMNGERTKDCPWERLKGCLQTENFPGDSVTAH